MNAGDLAPAVQALGTAAFAPELLATLNREIVADHLSLMRFEDRQRPPVIESAVWRGGEHVARVQRDYLAGLYRHDPSLKFAGPGPALLRLHREEISAPEYREACYLRSGLLERLTIATAERGRLVALNLYRREQSGPFTRREVETVEPLVPVLAALAAKHVGMLGTLLRSRSRSDRAGVLSARLHALDGSLTRRELDVLVRILLGMTTEGIALDLRISMNTVLTYRKRAYQRLGISSQSELFSLCVA